MKKFTAFLLAGLLVTVATVGYVSIDNKPASAMPCWYNDPNDPDVDCGY